MRPTDIAQGFDQTLNRDAQALIQTADYRKRRRARVIQH